MPKPLAYFLLSLSLGLFHGCNTPLTGSRGGDANEDGVPDSAVFDISNLSNSYESAVRKISRQEVDPDLAKSFYAEAEQR